VPTAAGAGEGSGIGGAAWDGFATQRPFRYSCQGKHWESSSDCALAGNEPKKTRPIKIAAVAEMRVIVKPRRDRKTRDKISLIQSGFASRAKALVLGRNGPLNPGFLRENVLFASTPISG
jgi:hypothetical protein